MAKYGTHESFSMRSPCRCGGTHGHIVSKGNQDCVYCDDCGRWTYNAPRTETGREVRSITTIHEGLTAKRKVAVKLRANGLCEICGRGPQHGELHVGHIISVKAGLEASMTDEEINSIENLMLMCIECNLGLKDETIPLRMMVRVVKARLAFSKQDDAA